MSDLSIPDYFKTRDAYKDIYEQYVDEASFLWVLRSVAIEQPHYFPSDIFELERRIDAQLDGLMTSLDIGWQVCEDLLFLQEPGEVFASMVVAMRSHEASKIQLAVETGLDAELATPGLISAMGWLPGQVADPWIERFLHGKDMKHKFLGIAACSVRRRDPGELLTTILQRDDCLEHEQLHARAIRLIGELRRQDCMPAIDSAMNSDSETVRFWACWSAILLGHHRVIQRLQPMVVTPGPFQDLAIQLAFRVLPVEQAREWISDMSQDAGQTRAVMKAVGVLGDPHAINWLISKMQAPELAKLAAESFSLITGVDLEKHQLVIDEPEHYPAIPNDDSTDEFVGMDEDENLPFPDINKVMDVWRQHGQHFIVGRRYFLGRPITADYLYDKLKHGTQRQRHAAAMELALNENEVQLPNTRARILSP